MSGDVIGRIASQDTLEAVRDRMGETGDTGGTYNSGTLTSKANAALLALGGANNGIDGLNNRLDGMVTPYGKGTYGDLIVGPDLAWPSQDGFNRYVLHTKSMTIPEGVTLTPPEKCDGLYILSQGDVTINGTIDVRGMRKTFTEDLQLAPTINVGSQEFVLAKGGYSPKGGANGTAIAHWSDTLYSSGKEGDVSAPVITPIESVAGNVNGGGISIYGANNTNSVLRNDRHGDDDQTPYSSVTRTGTSKLAYGEGTGAVIIIAKGTVTINGNILASATDGVNAGDGTEPQDVSSGSIRYKHTGLGGNGAVAPSGGGAVTIICNALMLNGKIDTNGKTFTSANGADKSVQRVGANAGGFAAGGSGGKGGTFISTAGEIKVYTGVSE